VREREVTKAVMRVQLVLALFAVCVFCQVAAKMPFNKCGENGAQVLSVDIDPCDMANPKRPACILRRKSFSTITIKFKAKKDTSLPIFSRVHGVIGGMKVPFQVIGPACKNVEKPEEKPRGGPFKDHAVPISLDCPLKEDQEYTFQYKLPINRAYPPMSVAVQWEMIEGKDGKPIFCVKMNTQIV